MMRKSCPNVFFQNDISLKQGFYSLKYHPSVFGHFLILLNDSMLLTPKCRKATDFKR